MASINTFFTQDLSTGYARITVVDGLSLTGLYAADGSINVVDRTADVPGLFGVMHPCGAVNVVAVDGTSYVGLYHASGALNVIVGDEPGKIVHSSGAIQVDTAVGVSDEYIVNNESPDTVADFAGVLNSGTEYYRVAGTETTFDSMFTYTGASNKTMTDSDGNLKWSPHNIATHSENLLSWIAAAALASVTANTDVAPDGETTADTLTDSSNSAFQGRKVLVPLLAGVQYTAGIWIKKTVGAATFPGVIIYSGVSGVEGSVAVNTDTGTATARTGVTTQAATGITVTSDGDYWLVKFNVSFASVSGTADFSIYPAINTDAGATWSATTQGSAVFWGAHLYRSDLGGMVNNWDRSPADSYVPTTTAARYLSRRNHYRYNGTSYVKKGLLLESAAATNLEANSTNPTAGSLGTVNATWAASSATTRDGNQSAYRLLGDGVTNGQHFRAFNNSGITFGSGTTYTLSVDVKPVGSQQYVALVWNASKFGAANTDVVFDLINGTVTAEESASVTGHIQNVGDGWFRCSITAPATANGTDGNTYFVALVDAGTLPRSDYVGSSSDGVDVAFFQVETGSVPTSYIPTSGATATRAAETLTIAGSNMAASTTAMSFHMQGEYNFADNNSGAEGQWLRWRADANNYIEERLATNTATANYGNLVSIQTAAATVDTVTSPSNSFLAGLNTPYNWATRHTASAMNLAVSGTAATENSTPVALPDLSAASCELGLTYRGTIALFRQDDSDWTDTGIEEATTVFIGLESGDSLLLETGDKLIIE